MIQLMGTALSAQECAHSHLFLLLLQNHLYSILIEILHDSPVIALLKDLN